MDGRTAHALDEPPGDSTRGPGRSLPGKLHMVLAEKVSRLTPGLKQQVADRIRKGEDPNHVVREIVTPAETAGKAIGERM